VFCLRKFCEWEFLINGLESKIDLALLITGGMFGDDALLKKQWRLIRRI
jgi:hypothetical protein